MPDPTLCPHPLLLIAAIEDPAVRVKILAHLGVPTRAPPRSPARIDECFQTASSHPGFRFSARADRLPLPSSPAHMQQGSDMLARS